LIPIPSVYQRNLLEQAKELAKDTPMKSLIPAYGPDPDGKRRDYKNHLKTYKAETKPAGCSHTHGLRHGAIQRMYEEGTYRRTAERHGQPGWKCGVAGGFFSNDLESWQHDIDREVRRDLMGHIGMYDVIAIYLGR